MYGVRHLPCSEHRAACQCCVRVCGVRHLSYPVHLAACRCFACVGSATCLVLSTVRRVGVVRVWGPPPALPRAPYSVSVLCVYGVRLLLCPEHRAACRCFTCVGSATCLVLSTVRRVGVVRVWGPPPALPRAPCGVSVFYMCGFRHLPCPEHRTACRCCACMGSASCFAQSTVRRVGVLHVWVPPPALS